MDALAALLPTGMAPWVAALLVVASFFTSALTAAFGVGGGIAMLALMGLFVPVASLIPVHGAVQLGSNTGRAWHQRAFVRMDVARPFIAGSVVGAIFGVFLVVQLPDALLKLVLGGFILVLTWAKIPGIDRLGKAGLAVASVALALLSMLVGATGPLVSVLFAQVLRERPQGAGRHQRGRHDDAAPPEDRRLRPCRLRLLGLAAAGRGDDPVRASSAPSTARRLLDRMPEETFRKWFRIGITVLALDLLRRGRDGCFRPQT